MEEWLAQIAGGTMAGASTDGRTRRERVEGDLQEGRGVERAMGRER